MAYMAYFLTNINKENETIQGLCNDMCPSEEVAMREKEKLVHILEVIGDRRKMVKSYSRSAADANMAKPKLLRPYNILRNTVEYLLLEVTKRSDVPVRVVYNFVTDRLRAVRQDMTIQRLTPHQNINLLEPMIRFHVYYGYKLCELPIKEYDPVLNQKYLLECLKWFLSCCDIFYKPSEKEHDLATSMFALNIKSTSKLICDRVLMESLYIICNLDDVNPVLRYLSLDDSLKGKALRILSHGYHSKQLTVPLHVLKKWLVYSSDSEVKDACLHYGLTVKGDAVMFCKTDFKLDVPTMLPKKSYSYENRLNLSIDNIFTYSSNKDRK